MHWNTLNYDYNLQNQIIVYYGFKLFLIKNCFITLPYCCRWRLLSNAADLTCNNMINAYEIFLPSSSVKLVRRKRMARGEKVLRKSQLCRHHKSLWNTFIWRSVCAHACETGRRKDLWPFSLSAWERRLLIIIHLPTKFSSSSLFRPLSAALLFHGQRHSIVQPFHMMSGVVKVHIVRQPKFKVGFISS